MSKRVQLIPNPGPAVAGGAAVGGTLFLVTAWVNRPTEAASTYALIFYWFASMVFCAPIGFIICFVLKRMWFGALGTLLVQLSLISIFLGVGMLVGVGMAPGVTPLTELPLSRPAGIAVSEEGDIYVIDGGRIQVYEPSGNFLRAWVVPSSIGEHYLDYFIRVDGYGQVVATTTSGVYVYTLRGELKKKVEADVYPSEGRSPARFQAEGPGGLVYVIPREEFTPFATGRVVRIAPSGKRTTIISPPPLGWFEWFRAHAIWFILPMGVPGVLLIGLQYRLQQKATERAMTAAGRDYDGDEGFESADKPE